MSHAPQIELKNLTAGYGSNTVLHNLSFGIDAGDFYIKTHPDLDSVVRDRFEAVLDGREAASTRLVLAPQRP